ASAQSPPPPQLPALQTSTPWVGLPWGLGPAIPQGQMLRQSLTVPGAYVRQTTVGIAYPERWVLDKSYTWQQVPAEFRPYGTVLHQGWPPAPASVGTLGSAGSPPAP